MTLICYKQKFSFQVSCHIREANLTVEPLFSSYKKFFFMDVVV